MANTTTTTGKVVTVTGLDADWIWSTDLPAQLQDKPLASVQFNPHATGDIFVLRNSSLTGAKVFYAKCTADTDQRVKYFTREEGISPAFESTDLTIGGATAMLILTFH
jgi:hypothetical protein